MIGGYLSFTGFEAKAAYRNTPVHEVCPWSCLPRTTAWNIPRGYTPK